MAKHASTENRSSGAAASRPRGAARAALIDAAAAEFEDAGFDGTDTNRIARRAGYAPQTFYRHFADKLDVFLAVYARWRDAEWRDLGAARAAGADVAGGFGRVIAHHRRHRMLRRALRALGVTEPRVRAARGASRAAQIDGLAGEDARAASRADAYALLLVAERFADALAEREPADAGVSERQARAAFIRALERLYPLS